MQLGSLSLLRIKLSNNWKNSRESRTAHSSVPSGYTTDYFIPLNVLWEVLQDISQFLSHSSPSAEAKDTEFYSPHAYQGPSEDIVALSLVKSFGSAAYKTAVWEEQANVHFSPSQGLYASIYDSSLMDVSELHKRRCAASSWLH